MGPGIEVKHTQRPAILNGKSLAEPPTSSRYRPTVATAGIMITPAWIL